LQTVKDAGFSEIRVDGESSFSTALAPDEPSRQKLATEYGVTLDKVSEVLESVTSLHLLVRK